MTLQEIFLSNVKYYLGKETKYWLAQKSGVPQSTISRVLGGHQQPTLGTIEQIAKGLNISPGQLLEDRTKVSKRTPQDVADLIAVQDDVGMEVIRSMLKALRPSKGKR